VMTPKNSSVSHITGLTTPTPTSSMPRYDQVEDSVYTVVCNITEMRVEADSDWHLVITDGKSTMIAECPCPSCNSVIASPYISQFTTCRNWIASHIGNKTNTSLSIKNVQITGQAFLDPPHGQSGAAPNNVELHSIFDIQFYVATGVDNVTDNSLVSVYPNPSSGLFHVSLSQSNAKIAVYNMIGEQVFESALTNGVNDVNMQGKAKGIYLYKILSETGDFVSSGKLLIQ
ncbi:MAG TPA: T9SS type A sorting domain-containing protein, partial [Bacteroidia bacterium]|nr:T9SS type A sorting domain-containing protein [Bacteroidia bacterium]